MPDMQRFRVISCMTLLGIVILSCFSDVSTATEVTIQDVYDDSIYRKKRVTQSIHMPKPKMNGRPIAYNGSIHSGTGEAEAKGGNEFQSYSYSPFSDVANGEFVESIHSKAAYFIGKCSIGSPFQFVVGGFSGKGVIGTTSRPISESREMQIETQIQEEFVNGHSSGLGPGPQSEPLETFITSIDFIDHVDKEEGEIVALMDQIEPHFFTFPSPSSPSTSPLESDYSNSTSSASTSKTAHTGFLGVPFIYNGVNSEALSPVLVSCSSRNSIDIIVIVGDDERKDVGATVTHTLGSDAVHIELTGAARSNKNLRAESINTTSFSDDDYKSAGQGRRHLRTIRGGGSQNDIWLEKAETRKRTLKKSTTDDDFGCSLVQMTIDDSLGKEVPKTLIICSEYHDSFRSRKLQQRDHYIRLKTADIDENGDVVFHFTGLESLELHEVHATKFDARIAIQCENNDNVIGVVDMSAMLSWNDLTLVVNGGWFRRAAKLHNVSCDWEPVVLDAIATDPDSKYQFLGRLDGPTSASMMKDSGSGRYLSEYDFRNRRNALKAPPSKDELDINVNMTIGRKPAFSHSFRNLRNLKRKKILVHGYCDAVSDFPIGHFTDAVQFRDPDSTDLKKRSWSNDQFARKIYKFAVVQGIDGCGIIGHSQGGMASLHLKEHYWSCLDNATGGSRLIQSVGTPYLGTTFAGTIAAIGGVFGVGCGTNHDLTESGAVRWLRSISPLSRKQVYYYLTGAKTGWFTVPCLFSADLFLSDPEDGVIERRRGELPGGNRAGYTGGQCHTGGMWHSHQCFDIARNKEMNSKARY